MENVGCFGLHAVDDRWREQGPTSVDVVVKRFTATVRYSTTDSTVV